jgi:hypothetical protein
MTRHEEIVKAKAKISKLLNMTQANGCSEDEEANAMRMAAGIALKLGIDLDAIRPAGAPKPKLNRKQEYRGLKVYEAYCVEAAGILYGVEVECENFGKHGFTYFGREENVDMAEQTMLWLVRQVELLYKEALPRGLSKRDRAEFRGSFKDACGKRIWQRAKELVADMKSNDIAARETTGHNALVVAGHFDTLAQEITEHHREQWKLSQERYKLAEQERADKRIAKLAAMSEEDRVKFLRKEHERQVENEEEAEKYRKRSERRDRRRGYSYSEPRQRNEKTGSGTDAGYAAGDRVKLRKEIE